MRTSGFDLYLNTESGIQGYSEHKNSLFTFSISEKKEGDIVIIKGSLKAHSNINLHWLDVMIPCSF